MSGEPDTVRQVRPDIDDMTAPAALEEVDRPRGDLLMIETDASAADSRMRRLRKGHDRHVAHAPLAEELLQETRGDAAGDDAGRTERPEVQQLLGDSVPQLEHADKPLRIVPRVEHRAAEPFARQFGRTRDEERDAKKPVRMPIHGSTTFSDSKYLW